MIEKLVSASVGMSTVVVGGDVVKVIFEGHSVNYVFIRHVSGEVLVSRSPNIADGVDGTVKLSAGGYRFDVSAPVIYISGSGVCEVSASALGDFPFKVGGKGGGVPDLSAYAKKTDVPNIKVNEAVNADTLGEKSADDFTQIIELGGDETDTKTAVGIPTKTTIYNCSNWTDFPTESPDGQGVLISVNYNGSGIAGTDSMWVVQFFISARTGTVYKRYINNTQVSSWCEIYSADNKPYITGSFSGTSLKTDSFDSRPSYAICNDNGTIKHGNIYHLATQASITFYVSFENLSDTTHQYIIFK